MSDELFRAVDEKLRGADGRDRALVEAYLREGRTLDDLPYTDEFERIYGAVSAGPWEGETRGAVLRRLQNLRKRSMLPRLGRAASTPVRVGEEDEARLRELVVGAVGTLGQRDQLAYTQAFEALVQAFNASTGKSLSAHDAWRLVAKLAK